MSSASVQCNKNVQCTSVQMIHTEKSQISDLSLNHHSTVWKSSGSRMQSSPFVFCVFPTALKSLTASLLTSSIHSELVRVFVCAYGHNPSGFGYTLCLFAYQQASHKYTHTHTPFLCQRSCCCHVLQAYFWVSSCRDSLTCSHWKNHKATKGKWATVISLLSLLLLGLVCSAFLIYFFFGFF